MPTPSWGLKRLTIGAAVGVAVWREDAYPVMGIETFSTVETQLAYTKA